MECDLRGLAEATRLIVASSHLDLHTTLDTLTAQARALFGADDAAVLLAEQGRLVRHRPRSLAVPGAPMAVAGAEAEPAPDVLAVVANGDPCFIADVRSSPALESIAELVQPSVTSCLVLPMVAERDQVGVLMLHWARRRRLARVELTAAKAVADHAAIAVRAARLVDETRAARAQAESRVRQLEAVLDASGDGIVVVDAGGRPIWANAAAERAFLALVGDERFAGAAFVERTRPERADGTPVGVLPTDRALQGHEAAELLRLHDANGAARWIHVRAAPAFDADGAVRAVVSIWRDVTDLYDAIAERSRFDGAVKTARAVVDRLGNRLGALLVNAELLAAMTTGDPHDRAAGVVRAGWSAVETLEQLRTLVRFVERHDAGTVLLDLDASTGR